MTRRQEIVVVVALDVAGVSLLAGIGAAFGYAGMAVAIGAATLVVLAMAGALGAGGGR